MLGQTLVDRDLDEFLQSPEFKGSVLIRPSKGHRLFYGIALLVGVLLVITGLANLISVFNRADHPASDTLTLGIGLLLILIGGALAWRFSGPFVFAAGVSEKGLAWRNLFGWHNAFWGDVDFVLVKRHSQFGGHEVHVKTGDGRMHFGWFDATDWYSLGPLESLPSDEGRSLVRTIVSRAGLQRREPGVWVRSVPEGEPPIDVSTGTIQW
jgi:hypothetical protein